MEIQDGIVRDERKSPSERADRLVLILSAIGRIIAVSLVVTGMCTTERGDSLDCYMEQIPID